MPFYVFHNSFIKGQVISRGNVWNDTKNFIQDTDVPAQKVRPKQIKRKLGKNDVRSKSLVRVVEEEEEDVEDVSNQVCPI